ncbi:sulfatase-like hydrolase/transferase [Verrucomicrobiaceae bacterium N1E253]|uniref:Sulfatase-like hydrolase/transferase n=1 Tax=Oceaniferula marina TaxID=2748318 RepID=A0A851GR75_9BACT|nr:sulfatase-like hydrolase/transferase [Oceaniferula marina]NWK57300.1 sulfatase-like hydrolase/transferase [Oceaniferula marina]
MSKFAAVAATVSSVIPAVQAQGGALPNVVVIYADDLGYGDVSCYNAESKVKTPNIDRIAAEGMMFTDGHSPDTICSPSRYGILSGRASWRTHRKKGNPAPGEQPWIEKTRLTLASMLKEKGYDTAAIGKWGVGSDWESAAKPGRKGLDLSEKSIDYTKPIHSGRCIGFTYDWVHLWFGHSYYSTKKYPWDHGGYRDGGRWFFENGMTEGGKVDFESFDMRKAQMEVIERSVRYIDAKGGRVDYPQFNQRKGKPFFLYYAAHIPHGPIVPAKQFQGSTQCGDYGDFVNQFDWAVGQITDALKRNGMLENTILVITSDNGPEHWSYSFIDKFKHNSMGELRGAKRNLWEGGHRVPFIVSWPQKMQKRGISQRLVSQLDLVATIADVVDYKIGPGNAEDSFSFASEFGQDVKESTPKRDLIIHHDSNNRYALRKGDWVFIDHKSGGPEPEWLRKRKGREKHNFPGELFNLKEDPYESNNLYGKHPEKVKEMKRLLDQLKKSDKTVTR